MSKKLKKRILELCGFNNLKRDERIRKANDILNSSELKQTVCTEILGTTHKDVERVMLAVLAERQLTDEQKVMLELEASVPEKFDLELDFKINKPLEEKQEESFSKFRSPTMEEVNKLLRVSSKEEFSNFEPPEPKTEYPMLPREIAAKLVSEHFQYKEEQRQKNLKLEQEEWDFTNQRESLLKIGTTKKPSKSTKG